MMWDEINIFFNDNSQVTEVQKMLECSTPGQLYSIDITSMNSGIPYADSFQVLLHYCLVR